MRSNCPGANYLTGWTRCWGSTIPKFSSWGQEQPTASYSISSTLAKSPSLRSIGRPNLTTNTWIISKYCSRASPNSTSWSISMWKNWSSASTRIILSSCSGSKKYSTLQAPTRKSTTLWRGVETKLRNKNKIRILSHIWHHLIPATTQSKIRSKGHTSHPMRHRSNPQNAWWPQGAK